MKGKASFPQTTLNAFILFGIKSCYIKNYEHYSKLVEMFSLVI